MPFVILNDITIDFKCQCEITDVEAAKIAPNKWPKVIDQRDPTLPERPLNQDLWPEYSAGYWGVRENGHA